jgi:hypothetical protein
MWLRGRIRAFYLISVLMMIGCGPARPDAKAIQQQLSGAVPLQSSLQQVSDYLNKQKIEHSDYLRDADRGYLIKAMVRDRSKWSLVRTDCGIEFRFDKDGHLLKYEVREHYTGP